jgi:hypothetical protein
MLIACAIPFASAYACTAFFKYEYTSNMNKICVYDHLGSDYAITVSAVSLCPLTVNARH